MLFTEQVAFQPVADSNLTQYCLTVSLQSYTAIIAFYASSGLIQNERLWVKSQMWLVNDLGYVVLSFLLLSLSLEDCLSRFHPNLIAKDSNTVKPCLISYNKFRVQI